MADPRRSSEDGSSADLSSSTLSVWAGEGESLVQGATQVPVVYSAAYGYPEGHVEPRVHVGVAVGGAVHHRHLGRALHEGFALARPDGEGGRREVRARAVF